MTPEELRRFKEEVADPAMRKIFARTEIPEGMCCIDKVNIEFLDGRSYGVDSLIDASGLIYIDGKVQPYSYEETDVSVEDFVNEHKGCSFISDGSLRVFDQLNEFEVKTELWNHGRCAKVFDGLECLETLDFHYQSMEFEKMKAIMEGSPLVGDGNREDGSHWKAVNIDWDVEENDISLPDEIEIPIGMTDEDEISDYITNVTGFCHFGFELVDSNGQQVSEIGERDEKAVLEPVTLQNAAAIEYKGIIFDDWDADGDGVWANICQCCAEKYKDLISGELDDSAIGICSVAGCDVSGKETDNEHHYYIDFKPELIHPLSKDQLAEIQGKSLEHQISGAEAIGSKQTLIDTFDSPERPER